jgi:hypothetical protein
MHYIGKYKLPNFFNKLRLTTRLKYVADCMCIIDRCTNRLLSLHQFIILYFCNTARYKKS